MTNAPPPPTPTGIAVNGTAVRERRKQLGHTISAFAPLVQVSIGYLSQIERGHRPTVSPPTFKRLATALGYAERPELIQGARRPGRRRKVA